jgi:hypothetical protein
MSLFKKRKKEEVDARTKIEKQFEEKGQEIGRKTGELVQKGLNKVDKVKQKLQEDGTIDKIRDLGTKVDDTIDKVVDKVAKETKKVVDKKKKPKTIDTEEELFYE